MIAFIRGELIETESERVVVDVGGVGYGVRMPGRSIAMLPALGNEVRIHTYLNIREDCMQLFGFLTRDELTVFKMVLAVSGVGPKYGLNLLSALSPDELRFAILANDVKAITKAQGIGKKMAEKIILELKDKFDMEDVLDQGTGADGAGFPSESEGIRAGAVQALVALGYSSAESVRAVKKVSTDTCTAVEDVLKQALANMMFQG